MKKVVSLVPMHRKLRLYFSICCAVACAAASPIRAQENAQASAYLEQAAAGMLQRTAGNPPFHLTATFTLVKPIVLKDGSALDAQGKYEETWLALDNWRKDVTIGPNYHLVLIRKGDEMWRSGESIEEVSRVLAAIIPDVAIPPQYALMEKFQSGHPGTESKWDVQTVKLGTIDVIRVGLASAKVQQGRRSMLDDAFYFDPSTKALIMRSEAPTAYEYTTGGKLDGRFVPLDGNVEEMNRLIASFHISSLKANPRVDAATFVPGPEFTEIPRGRYFSGAEDQRRRANLSRDREVSACHGQSYRFRNDRARRHDERFGSRFRAAAVCRGRIEGGQDLALCARCNKWRANRNSNAICTQFRIWKSKLLTLLTHFERIIRPQISFAAEPILHRRCNLSSGTRLPISSTPSATGSVSSKTASLVKLRMAKLSIHAIGQGWSALTHRRIRSR